MHIALATYSGLPDWEVDDQPLHAALEERGHTLVQPAWDDPKVDWPSFDMLLPRTTWNYHLAHESFIAWLTAMDTVTCLMNPLPLLLWNLDKQYLAELEQHCAPVIPTSWLQKGTVVDLATACRADELMHAMVKPSIASTAYGSLHFNTREPEEILQAQAHLDTMLTNHDMLLQPYYRHVEEHGEFSLIFIDGQFSHGVQKIPAEGDYRVQDDFGASDVPWNPDRSQIDASSILLSRLPHHPLYARCDYLIDDKGEMKLVELELIEPSLFFRHDSTAARRLVSAIEQRACIS